jgi:hypothetical protein
MPVDDHAEDASVPCRSYADDPVVLQREAGEARWLCGRRSLEIDDQPRRIVEDEVLPTVGSTCQVDHETRAAFALVELHVTHGERFLRRAPCGRRSGRGLGGGLRGRLRRRRRRGHRMRGVRGGVGHLHDEIHALAADRVRSGLPREVQHRAQAPAMRSHANLGHQIVGERKARDVGRRVGPRTP